MKNFSLILPSRERIPLLEKLLASIERTVVRPDAIEVLVAIDDDDPQSLDSVDRLQAQYAWLRFVIMPRQSNVSNGYHNNLAMNISVGRYVMALNDDCYFTTKNWDVFTLMALEDYQRKNPDGIVYGRTKDDLGCGYACFPLLSREALNAMGFFFHCETTTSGADILIHNIYSKVNRVLDLDLCTLIHETPNDELHREYTNRASYNWNCADGEAWRLQNHILSLTAASGTNSPTA
jgi:glycosyltransferase involved in cell wall biosynthesis